MADTSYPERLAAAGQHPLTPRAAPGTAMQAFAERLTEQKHAEPISGDKEIRILADKLFLAALAKRGWSPNVSPPDQQKERDRMWDEAKQTARKNYHKAVS